MQKINGKLKLMLKLKLMENFSLQPPRDIHDVFKKEIIWWMDRLMSCMSLLVHTDIISLGTMASANYGCLKLLHQSVVCIFV